MVGLILHLVWIPCFCIQMYVLLVHNNKVGTGRRLTFPLQAAILRKLFGDPNEQDWRDRYDIGSWSTGRQLLCLMICDPYLFRCLQLLVLLAFLLANILENPHGWGVPDRLVDGHMVTGSYITLEEVK